MRGFEDLEIEVPVVNLVSSERLSARRSGERHYDERQGNQPHSHNSPVPESFRLLKGKITGLPAGGSILARNQERVESEREGRIAVVHARRPSTGERGSRFRDVIDHHRPSASSSRSSSSSSVMVPSGGKWRKIFATSLFTLLMRFSGFDVSSTDFSPDPRQRS